jgi:hypothetical protein
MSDNPCDDKSPSAGRERVIDQKSEVTGRISDTCRIIGFGLLIFYFTVHFNDSSAAGLIRQENSLALYAIGLFGVLTVLFDYLQYFCGSIAAKAALRNENNLYDNKSLAYKARNFMFILKQSTAFLGALVLMYVMAFPSGWNVAAGAFCRIFAPSA